MPPVDRAGARRSPGRRSSPSSSRSPRRSPASSGRHEPSMSRPNRGRPASTRRISADLRDRRRRDPSRRERAPRRLPRVRAAAGATPRRTHRRPAGERHPPEAVRGVERRARRGRCRTSSSVASETVTFWKTRELAQVRPWPRVRHDAGSDQAEAVGQPPTSVATNRELALRRERRGGRGSARSRDRARPASAGPGERPRGPRPRRRGRRLADR